MRFFDSFLRLMIWFPSVTFSAVKSEIFPWAFAYAVSRRRFKITILLIFLVLIIHSLIVSYYYWGALPADMVRSFAAYLNGPLVFFAVSRGDSKLHAKTAKTVFVFLIILSLLQMASLMPGALLQMLVPRSNPGMLEVGGRGITLLSSEPSRAAYELVFLALLVRSVTRSKYKVIIDVTLICIVTFFVRSMVGLLFLILYMSVYGRFKLVIASVLLALFGLSMLEDRTGIRGIDVLFSIIGSKDFSSLLFLVMNEGGFRAISLLSSVQFPFYYPLGGGVGSWAFSSLEALQISGYAPTDIQYFMERGGEFFAVRPSSFFSSALLDLGFLIIPILGFWFWKIAIVLRRNCTESREAKTVFYLFAFYIVVIGSIGNPIPWIVLGWFVSVTRTGIRN